MLDIVVETMRALILGSIVGFLWWTGKRNSLPQHIEWRLIITGFALLLFGAVIDITDNFDSLNKFVVIGDTDTEALLEKTVGYLLGFFLLAVGLWKWVPSVTRQDRMAALAPPASGQAASWPRKWILTTLFTFTAILAIPIAVTIVNQVVGDRAEGSLIQLAENNSRREAHHLQLMAARMLPAGGGQDAMAAMHFRNAGPEHTNAALQPQPASPTLEFLAGPNGIPGIHESLVQGLNFARLSLTDMDGKILWSSDPDVAGGNYGKPVLLAEAASSGISSEFVRDDQLTDFSGIARRADLMKMLLPIHNSATGEVIGFIQADRDVTEDVTFQVDGARSAVLLITVATMGGLFLVLFGFILAADMTIQQSRLRELSTVEELNHQLEERVRERTRELEGTQEQLYRSEKLAAIGQLAGGLAHDLRNPLGAINNALFYLKRKLEPSDIAESDPRIGQFLKIASDEVAHSSAIVNDLMTFAQVRVPELSANNLEEVVGKALATMESREGLRITQQFESGMPEVMADGEQLYRVFLNLVNNARDAMPGGGELTISVHQLDEFAEASFKDTGVGISVPVMEKIFDPLFTTKTNGTGLGLAVCHQIVEKHGGQLTVKSQEGQGATFTVRLPLNGRDQPETHPDSSPNALVQSAAESAEGIGNES